MTTFTLSIEPTEGTAFQHLYHLGTDEAVARYCAEDIFGHRQWYQGRGRVTIRTVALMRDGRMFDCFDGQWASDVAAADMAAMEDDYYGMVEERTRHP
jgi:hypothetical protein